MTAAIAAPNAASTGPIDACLEVDLGSAPAGKRGRVAARPREYRPGGNPEQTTAISGGAGVAGVLRPSIPCRRAPEPLRLGRQPETPGVGLFHVKRFPAWRAVAPMGWRTMPFHVKHSQARGLFAATEGGSPSHSAVARLRACWPRNYLSRSFPRETSIQEASGPEGNAPVASHLVARQCHASCTPVAARSNSARRLTALWWFPAPKDPGRTRV